MMRERRQRNIQGTHLSVDSWEDAACHNPPDLRGTSTEQTRKGESEPLSDKNKWEQESLPTKVAITCCIKKAKCIGLSPNHHCHCIIVKHLLTQTKKKKSIMIFIIFKLQLPAVQNLSLVINNKTFLQFWKNCDYLSGFADICDGLIYVDVKLSR